MSVKSTKQVTRQEALVALLTALQTMPDSLLEDLLERVNDTAAGGECFENYRIVPEWMRELQESEQ